MKRTIMCLAVVALAGSSAAQRLVQRGVYAEDAASADADYGLSILAAVRSTVVGSTATAGDWATLNVSTVGALHVIETGAGALTCGNEDVSATGTAEQLGSNVCKKVLLSCPAANTSACYVRGSAGNGVTGGMVIAKSTSVTLDLNQTNLIWVDAGTNADDVTWCCVN